MGAWESEVVLASRPHSVALIDQARPDSRFGPFENICLVVRTKRFHRDMLELVLVLRQEDEFNDVGFAAVCTNPATALAALIALGDIEEFEYISVSYEYVGASDMDGKKQLVLLDRFVKLYERNRAKDEWVNKWLGLGQDDVLPPYLPSTADELSKVLEEYAPNEDAKALFLLHLPRPTDSMKLAVLAEEAGLL